MFRTDFNLWLQSFESDGLTFFMQAVSFLGNLYPLMIIGILSFSIINFRKGIIVFNTLGITAVITIFLKVAIDYPRPVAVDPNILPLNMEVTSTDFTSLQPAGSFEVFSNAILEATRNSEIGRYGLPSGHTSIQIAVWITLALLFQRKWLWILSVSFVLLTTLSRLYLGVHYLGDILGGLIVGFVSVFFVISISRYSGFQTDQKVKQKHLLFFLFPILLLFLSTKLSTWQGGIVLGSNAGIFIIIRNKEFPQLSPLYVRRIVYSMISLVTFLGFFFLGKVISDANTYGMDALIMGLAGFLSFTVISWVGLKWGFLIENKDEILG